MCYKHLPLEHLFVSFRIRSHSCKLSFSVRIIEVEGGMDVFEDVVGGVLGPESGRGPVAHPFLPSHSRGPL